MDKTLYNSQVVKFPQPINYLSKDSNLFLNKEKRSWPVYYELKEDLTANHELFVKKSIKILPLSFGDAWQDKKYNTPTYLLKNSIKDLVRKNHKVRELVWILDQFSTGGYYHWLTEILPRLWIANDLKIPLDVPIYLPEYFFTKWNFGEELLIPFKRKFLTFKSSELLKISKMHFISQNGGPLAFQQIPLRSSTQVLIDHYYDKNWPYRYPKLYISRNKGNKRILVNEEDILPRLKRDGFEVLYTEELSISDQINLFTRANVVLSIHGAGLTNMVFMPQGSSIIEIRNQLPDHMNNCFLALANTLSHLYYYVLGEMHSRPGESRPIDHSISVNIQSLNHVLDQVS